VKRILYIFFFLIFFGYILQLYKPKVIQLFNFSNNQESGIILPSQLKEISTHTLNDMHVVEAYNETKDWELFADIAKNIRGEGVWNLKGVKVNFYNEDKIDFTVSGDSAVYDSSTRGLNFEGDIVGTMTNQNSFATQSLSYNPFLRKVISDTPVTFKSKINKSSPLESNGMTLNAHKMETHIVSQDILFSEGVNGHYSNSETGNIKISAVSAKVSKQNQNVEFFDNVVMFWPQGQFESDYLLIESHPVTQKIENILFKGNVRLHMDNRFASCGKARLIISSQAIELDENPRIIENQNQIEGEKIIINYLDNSVIVNKMKANLSEGAGR